MFLALLQELPADLQIFVNIFGDSAAILLVLAGLMAFVWVLHDGYRRGGFLRPKKEEFHDEINILLKIIVILGIFLGVVLVATGVITIMLNLRPSNAYGTKYGDHYDLLTSVSLIIVGFAMFIKPLKDVPWATLIGFIAGCALGIFVVLAIPDRWLEAINYLTSWDTRWVIAVVFMIVATVAGLFIKFWFSGIEMVSRFISWPPMALVIGIYCLIQGFSVWVTGTTLYYYVI